MPPKETLNTAFNMPRSSLSILKKIMLIMFMDFPLCGYVCLNSWTSLGYVVINLSLSSLKTDISASISYLRFTGKIPRNRTISNLLFIFSNLQRACFPPPP